MATDKQHDLPSGGKKTDQQAVDRSAVTQVGQVIQGLGQLTRRLTVSRAQPRSTTQQRVTASPERISVLIEALGDPHHPEHASAVDALTEIGLPAVPLLAEVLDTRDNWLLAYRAAEALGYIGEGQATGALIQALRHPNSNVRWSAVRALGQIGDLRAVLELRRLATDDHGRTSWGEPVAGTAQSVLDQMRVRSAWGQGVELIKTAITSVLMILAIVLAFSVTTALMGELERISDGSSVVIMTDLPTATPQPTAEPAAALATPTPFATPTPLASPTIDPAEAPLGTVLQGANVRPLPSTDNQPIGELRQGDEVRLLARNTAGDWYLVQLGETFADSSFIRNPNGSEAGWVNESLLSLTETVDLPVEEPGAAPVPSPTAENIASPTPGF